MSHVIIVKDPSIKSHFIQFPLEKFKRLKECISNLSHVEPNHTDPKEIETSDLLDIFQISLFLLHENDKDASLKDKAKLMYLASKFAEFSEYKSKTSTIEFKNSASMNTNLSEEDYYKEEFITPYYLLLMVYTNDSEKAESFKFVGPLHSFFYKS